MLRKNEIQEAARTFDSSRYPLEFYQHHLDLLKKAKTVNSEVRKSVRELFIWRMGKVRSTKNKVQLSDTATLTSFADAEGNPHYALGITETTQKAIQIGTSDDLLRRGMDFRDRNLSFGEFSVDAKTIVRTSIYLPCFFVHLWRPDEYPLFERNSFAVAQSEKGKSFVVLLTPNRMVRYLEYTEWFNYCVSKHRIDRWTAQLGLWELGRRREKAEQGSGGTQEKSNKKT